MFIELYLPSLNLYRYGPMGRWYCLDCESKDCDDVLYSLGTFLGYRNPNSRDHLETFTGVLKSYIVLWIKTFKFLNLNIFFLWKSN